MNMNSLLSVALQMTEGVIHIENLVQYGPSVRLDLKFYKLSVKSPFLVFFCYVRGKNGF
ncbi:hypothetical protein [Piscirickettsia salmonis]|uniref:Uncharacterized protein n=1 Tax=Piscirickettsia salmonis TaxID=1238 RepID=A0A9Q6LNE5_PISSA|nr:hypothetical protein [Piscirickettsia salmonis]QGN78652.1 hypothetical protein Psal001_02895 [Piscirickettsia salmonis]QGN82234.1 hypothetical protein Psal002_02912 [Piscirickettsia salmonis]QGN85813.1 hypothetical protein Psal003_02901 [Piscirickettsia salmonis]QGN89319.1 hypothetical protein Psal004_02893 [Piscirickettsia salmonis]QGN92869.1 hypothetical protein Psal005_02940 [Piscirickettsia salmonis]